MKSKLKFLKSNAFSFTFKLLVSLVLLFLIFKFAGLDNVYNELSNSNLYYILLSVPFAIFQIFFRALRWCMIVKMFNKSLDIYSSTKYTLISLAFGIVTPARLGELIKVKYLADKTKISYLKSFATVFLDKFFDILAVILLIAAGLSFFYKEALSFYVYLLLIIFIALLFLALIYIDKVITYLSKFLLKLHGKTFEKFSFGKKAFIKPLAYSMLTWLALILQAFFIAKALNITQISFIDVMIIVPLMALSSVLPVSIGGIGVREIVAIYFFSNLGVPIEKSAAFSLINTFIAFVMPAAIGAILYLSKKK